MYTKSLKLPVPISIAKNTIQTKIPLNNFIYYLFLQHALEEKVRKATQTFLLYL